MYLEELRNQFDILKQELKKQEIVSDRMLRTTMKSKNKDISMAKREVYVAAVMCLLFIPLTCYTKVWSLAFAIATCVMMLFCIAATIYIHKPVDKLNFMKDDFSTVARVMAKFKRQYDNWLRYVAPALMIPWLTWACYELAWKHAPAGSNPWLLCIPLIIGAVIGGLIGYYYHNKAANAAQDIIDEIEEK